MKPIVLALALSGLCFAQSPAPAASPTAATPTQAPAAAPARTIFDYQAELGLSDKQVSLMKTELANLNSAVKQSQEQIRTLEQEYAALLQQNAAVPACKSKLQQIANATVAMRLNDLQTSRRITGVMTPAQLKKWRDIQAEQRTKK